tara:strand:- start:1115 stop:1297 length:183 start_codon:yes stop_codon:yes gene_type:complete
LRRIVHYVAKFARRGAVISPLWGFFPLAADSGWRIAVAMSQIDGSVLPISSLLRGIWLDR